MMNCCNNFVLAKIITLFEIGLTLGFLVLWTVWYYLGNVQYSLHHVAYHVYSVQDPNIIILWWAVGVLILANLIVEYYGIHKERYGIVIFSLFFRCLQVIGFFGLLIHFLITVIAIQHVE